jgi:3-dehydroquinate synthase
MKPMSEIVRVELGQRTYDISIKDGLLDSVGPLLKSSDLGNRAVIVTNTTVAPLYLDTVHSSMQTAGFDVSRIILPDGEQFKNLDTMRLIYDELLKLGLDRSSALIALGGGVIGDMTGFAAASFLRGIPFVQIPTTLLAQVDSSVGGKTGINLAGGKNMVGAFYQPAAVIIDPLVLETLPARELSAGIAEVIKYGIICDSDFFAFLATTIDSILQLDGEAVSTIISRCCSLKADITSRDETEKGIRAHLNYGHTIGHAVETLTGYSEYLHGEAVAIGMVAAARLSRLLGCCSSEDVERIENLIKAARLPVAAPALPAGEYIQAMQKDKKKTGTELNFILLKSIGEVFLQPVAEEQLRKLLASR